MLVSSSSLESGAHTFPPPVATTTTSGSEDYQRSSSTDQAALSQIYLSEG